MKIEDYKCTVAQIDHHRSQRTQEECTWSVSEVCLVSEREFYKFRWAATKHANIQYLTTHLVSTIRPSRSVYCRITIQHVEENLNSNFRSKKRTFIKIPQRLIKKIISTNMTANLTTELIPTENYAIGFYILFIGE